MNKRSTVYDVAERAGVSIATVSFTFRQPERVKAETRAIVRSAARELGYVPSASARGLAAGRTGVLGVYSFEILLEGADDPSGVTADAHEGDDASLRLFPLYVDVVQRGFELECRAHGYATMLGSASRERSEAITEIAGRVDGAAVLTGIVGEADDVATIGRVIPLVLVSQPPNADFDSIGVENARGIRELTDHLILVHGKRDLVFVGDPGAPEIGDRYRGFLEALSNAGLAPSGGPLPFQGDRPPEQAADALGAFIRERGLPEAFVCGSDQGALSLMDVLSVLGIKVPQDTAVTGFDGIIAGRISNPALTTVAQPMEQLGRRAANMLIQRLSNPTAPIMRETLPVSLRIRHSCGCPD
jgi:LacI family transcriptional regulator